LSSSEGPSAEALMIRGRSSNWKGKGEHERSKFRPRFRDLKKKRYAFCREIGHWKVDCPMINNKSKKKELKTEANLTQVVSTHASTSHADRLDSDLSIFSFSVTTLIIGYSGDSE